jgi:hypothetical protein
MARAAVTAAIQHELDSSGITYPKATPTPQHVDAHGDAVGNCDADGPRDTDTDTDAMRRSLS